MPSTRAIGVLLIILFSASLHARQEIQWDRSLSSSVGARNLFSIHKSISAIEELFLKPRLFKEETAGWKTVGILYRIARTALIDNIIDHLVFLTQHEYFGHGARYREFGYKQNNYKLNLFPPYGSGRGSASRGQLSLGRVITAHENMVMSLAGSRSNALMAGLIRSDWLLKNQINTNEAILYIITSLDLPIYIWRTKWNPDHLGHSNDVRAYLNQLNQYEMHVNGKSPNTTLDVLARHTSAALFDPLLYYSIYAFAYSFLWKGDHQTGVPMIPLGGVKWLPLMRMGLTPFGTEFIFDNYLMKNCRLINASFRTGGPTFHRFYGFGLSVNNLVYEKKWKFNVKIELWKQPKLILGDINKTIETNGWGGLLAGTVNLRLSDASMAPCLIVQAGYKTAGYLEGERLSRGPVFRIGLQIEHKKGNG